VLDIAPLLRSLKENGEILVAVTYRVGETTTDIIQRRAAEGHPCLICGRQAHTALIAHTATGDRWLDLCPSCNRDTARNVDQTYPNE
jgi:hypothetical protein